MQSPPKPRPSSDTRDGIPAETERRLARLSSGPTSKRLIAADGFEIALLQAWAGGISSGHQALSRWLPASRIAELEALRERYRSTTQAEEGARFLAHVFQVLPKPILVRSAEGVIWNRAFAERLVRESRGSPRAQVATLRRFERLFDHAGELGVARLFVPLGGSAFSVHREDFPGGAALYLSPLALPLPALPTDACSVGLLKASGLAHKQIALLCGRSKSHVDHLSARHRAAFLELRASLCHADND